MAALVTLDDLILAHKGINSIINTLYPFRGRHDEEEEGGRGEDEEGDNGQPTFTATEVTFIILFGDVHYRAL